MKYIITFIALLTLAPSLASAATLSVAFTPRTVGVGDAVEITLSVQSLENVNAFSGTLKCSPSLVFSAIDDGNSIITAWIKTPAQGNEGIDFAGITAGGFSGSGGKLFSAILKATSAGTASCTVSGAEILKDDGAGGAAPVSLSTATLSIGRTPTGGFIEAESRTAPEPFTIYAGKDEEFYDGKLYLTFSALDKGPGIAGYEAAETRFPSWLGIPLHWVETGTVYVPEDQWGTSDVYIRATDREGNVRTEVFPRTHLLRPYEEIIGAIVIVIALLCYFFLKRRGHKR